MNKLYGILLGNSEIPADYSWYAKNYTIVPLTDRGLKLRDAFISTIQATDRISLFAALVCYLVLLSPYGKEIQELDSNNTYVQITRPDDSTSSNVNFCVYDLIKPAYQYEKAVDYLDEDIKEIMDNESFISIAGAVCLQLLREVL